MCTSCVVTVEDKSEEREFRQKLNEYIKKHQKTDFEKLENVLNDDTILYPLEIINLNGSKALVCLYCNFHYLESSRNILLTLYAENYFSDKEINKILKEYAPAYGDTLCDIDDRFLFEGKIAGIYGGCDLNNKYVQYKEEELNEINKEAPDFTCRIDTVEDSSVATIIE